MADRIVLDSSGGVRKTMIQDRTAKKIYIESKMAGSNVQRILDRNQVFRRETKARNWGFVGASIPRTVLAQWYQDWRKPLGPCESVTWGHYKLIQLNKPEYAYLRTVDHRLAIPESAK